MSTPRPLSVELDALDVHYEVLRMRSPEAVSAVERSLRSHGQLTAISVVRQDEQFAVLDGFKRLRAARELGWTTLRAQILDIEGPQAKAAVLVLNEQGGLSELEQGWLVASLYRDDGLNQPQIGVLLGRHKSWVCRRLLLVEQLCDAVQVDVRLGLLPVRSAVALARLPRCNQGEVEQVVLRRGLTTAQTEQLVAAFLPADPQGRRQVLDDWASGRGTRAPFQRRRPSGSTPAQRILTDVTTLSRTVTRLQARLLEHPLEAFGAEAGATIRLSLTELNTVLAPLVSALMTLTKAPTQGGEEQKDV